jgi:uncharacterized protein (TIGR00369 family)
MTLFEPSDPDFSDRVRASFDAQGVMRELGVSITALSPGEIDLLIDHQDRLTQQHGYLHAGILATAMDSACGYAAFSLMPADAAVLTVEYKVNLLRPAQASGYRVRGSVIKPGRTLTVCEARAYPADSDEPLAVMVATIMTLVGARIEH